MFEALRIGQGQTGLSLLLTYAGKAYERLAKDRASSFRDG